MKVEATIILKALAQKHHEDIFIPECNNGPTGSSYRRIDAWVMNRSWVNLNYIGYEIKVSRSDFLQDKKWVEYLPMCNQLVFVAPRGMIQKSEIPPECGFAEFVGTKILTRKIAPKRKIEPPVNVLNYVLMNRVQITREQLANNLEFFKAWLREAEESKDIGNCVRERLNKVTRDIHNENYHLKLDNEKLAAIKQTLAKMGFDNFVPQTYQVERRLQYLLAGIPEDAEGYLQRLQASVNAAVIQIQTLKTMVVKNAD